MLALSYDSWFWRAKKVTEHDIGLTERADKAPLMKRSTEELRGSRSPWSTDGKHSLQKVKKQKQRND